MYLGKRDNPAKLEFQLFVRFPPVGDGKTWGEISR